MGDGKLEARVINVANEKARERLYAWVLEKQKGFAGDRENSEGYWMVKTGNDEYFASNGYFYYKIELSGGMVVIDLWQKSDVHQDGWRRYPEVRK